MRRGRGKEGAPETRQWNLIGKRARREFYARKSKSYVKGYLISDFQSCANNKYTSRRKAVFHCEQSKNL